MTSDRATTRIHGVALAGLVALASAMGIGRFAFTPMLPLMQAAGQLSLDEGAWLAAANYAGYLVGALALVARRPSPSAAARIGLVAVALATLAMAVSDAYAAWLAFRFVAGVASACVLVGVTAWALPLLAAAGRSDLSGVVFAGVGAGIAAAGLIGRWAAVAEIAPGTTWLTLGMLAAAACVTMRPLHDRSRSPAAAPAEPLRFRDAALPIACYGAFGFGYILPATFLPALAREALHDAALFGWAWPLFGLAAAVSTLGASRLRRVAPAGVWAGAHVIMAAGVLAPVVSRSFAAMLASALCVGGTFMIATMAGIEYARTIAGRSAPRLIAAMTAAFAAGQLAGPIVLGASARHGAIELPGAVAALLLIASSVALWRRGARAAAVLTMKGNEHERKR